MHANLPEIANRWEAKYGLGGIAELNSQLNSLPEYYLPKNQGGRIGFDTGTPKDFQKFLNERKEAIREEDLDRLMEQYKQWYKRNYPQFEEAAHGGLIPAHQAGIYGLAEGGRTGFQYGSPHEEAAASYAGTHAGENAARDTPSHGDVAHGPGGRFDVANQPTQTTTTSTGDARERYISEQYKQPPRYKTVESHIPHTDEIVTTQIRDYYDPKGHQKRAPQTTQEKSLLDKIAFWTGAIVTGGALAGIKVPGAVQTVNTALSYRKNINWGINKLQELGVIDNSFTVDEVFQGFVDDAKKRKAKMDEYKSLPKGHPDRVALEIELEIGKKPEHLGDDGGTQETGIKYENIEEVNDQMARASADANRIQEKVDRSKQDAYYAAFRQKYLMGDTEEPQTMFIAQGGRVPQGYNTGGLSNLFRLKNR